ncbi:MAG: sigma-70 family RNA polymerase sigma factor [Pseudomonadales bacterium]|nr:sigma-70 family RNA polymerase sigma factor [Pseudomonadales bacterium]
MITASRKSVNEKKVLMLAETSPDYWSELLVKVGSAKDREAFSQLFEHFAPLVKGFLMKGSSLDPEQAEELVQETMIKVWRKAASFRKDKSAASTWIYTIARNSRIDWIRKEVRNSRELSADDIYETAEDNPSYSSLLRVRNQKSIRENLDQLPQEQLEVIGKIYFEGKSHSEVAEELSLPLGTVKSRIRLALSRMQLKLGQAEPAGSEVG